MIVDHIDKTISIKIVYFGPALSGKTTSIKALLSIFGKEEEICSIESTVERTLFFDYGIVTFQNQDWKIKIHIYTTTGQDFYIITRLITLRATDGIIFVLDSQKEVYERNITSWKELLSYFSECIEDIPIIIAFNKQDLPMKFDPENFLQDININNYKNTNSRYTSAKLREGILECFENVLQLILKKYYKNRLVNVIN
ncbi:MAG: GTP-binding protein [Promethearchaeota archaeon]|jgi:small GTP-binding protein